ncbi:ABC transporter ATP-binding protein [Brachybacterium huguangmaarense]
MRELMPLLPSQARSFIRIFGVTSALLALMDTAALAVLTAVLTQLMSHPSSFRIPVIGTRMSVEQGIFLLLGAAGLMVLKAVLNIVLQRWATRRFAHFEQEIGARLFDSYIRAPWTERLSRSSAEVVRMVDVGIANTMTGVIVPYAQLPTYVLTFVGALVILLTLQPVTAIITLVYLVAIALIMYVWISRRSFESGRDNRLAGTRMVAVVSEMISALKEITLRDKADEVAATVYGYQREAAQSRATIRFLGAVPRFIIDIALIGGVILIGTVAYIQGGMAPALTAVAVFGIGGYRMVPAITALQAQSNQMNASLTHAEAVVRDIRDAERYRSHAEHIGLEALDGDPRALRFWDVGFTYPGATTPAICAIDLTIPIGSTFAVVGASGAGKSTLIDLLLGLLTPSSGRIELDEQNLEDVLAAWRQRVGYVPQDVAIFDGTIAQNVSLTWGDDVDEVRVRDALAQAQLLETVLARSDGIHERVGERGIALSGGERQRLGIARALYVRPLVLVLDEATSSLDTATEAAVTDALTSLRGEVTVISVAHRLSTIRGYDQVCFMKDGRIVALGAFDDVVAAVPDFAQQAVLAGLVSPAVGLGTTGRHLG